MSRHEIHDTINQIIAPFGEDSSLQEVREIATQLQLKLRQFFAGELQAPMAEPQILAQAAAQRPDEVHRVAERFFGFDPAQQPDYGDIDDVAWRMSQKITDLSAARLPANARFSNKQGRNISRADMEAQMAGGEHYLFDIALSNEYVLLGKDESFSVRDIEQRFSTNNEHLSPQSLARRVGNVKVFKSDPRMIIISDMQNNGDRGHLQVVFRDENRNTQEAITMVHEPGREEPLLLREVYSADSNERYEIGPEDAPYYAYALALTHFADGFTRQADSQWFDRNQASEVLRMLQTLSEQGVDGAQETVLRDMLADAKQLGGNVNPVALVPEVFAAALEAELEQGKFSERGSEHSFVRAVIAGREAAQQDRAAGRA